MRFVTYDQSKRKTDLNGWPTASKYVGMVIDEAVRDDENDWKLLLPIPQNIDNNN